MKNKNDVLSSDDVPDLSGASLPNPKRMIAYQIEREMGRQGVSRVEMAKRMGTSRMQLNRLLDPDNDSVTLQSLEKAALSLGMRIVISFEPS